MRLLLAAVLVMTPLWLVRAQPADCFTQQPAEPALPLSLDLPGKNGQVYLAVPTTPPGIACGNSDPAPSDILHGELGDALRGPGTPRVEIELR